MDLLFDDRCSRVVGFVMRSGYLFRTRQVVEFSDVRRIGPNAVVMDNANPRRLRADEIAALGAGRLSMQGRPVFTRQGEYLGAVHDVVFDEASGRVLGFEVAYPEAHRRSRRRIGVPADQAKMIANTVVVSQSGS